MLLNQFSVRVTNGREVANGYVELSHGTQYALVLRNEQSRRCDAKVTIDGKEIGTFRLNSHGNITLERKPGEDAGKFTFFKEGTSEAKEAQIETGSPNNGLITVVFTPERVVTPIVTHTHHWEPDYEPWIPRYQPHWGDWQWKDNSVYTANSTLCETKGLSGSCSRSAGGTGLTGHSDQNFYDVGPIDYDLTGQTTINLRLVATDEKAVRPLVGQSSPIPPYIK